jgi:hypothetical protein
MVMENYNARQDNQWKREERCTAPHPVLPFLFFLVTLALVFVAFYLLTRLLR